MFMHCCRLCSVRDDLCLVSNIGEKDCVFNWLPSSVTCHMDSKSEMNKDVRCDDIKSLQKNDAGFSMSRNQSSNTSESSFNFVYQRKKPLKNFALLSRAHILTKTSPDTINFVYKRRKCDQSGLSNVSSVVSASTSPNGTCSSATRSQNHAPLSTKKTIAVHEQEDVKDSTNVCSFICGSDSKEKMNKAVELSSVDDSCSSSILNMDDGLIASKTRIDDTDECSSSGAHATDASRDDLSVSVNDLCISILQSHGLLRGSGASEEDAPSCSGSSHARTCNACDSIGVAVEMLICDECEEAFHLSCFNPSIKKIPADDWYCQSCAKKKNNLRKERAVRKSSIIGSRNGSATSDGNSSAIELMLKDTEPYISGVRVGKGFQAIVPEWSGPMIKDLDVFPQPLELDLSHTMNFPGSNYSKHDKCSFIGNWVQCRQVITGMGGNVDGTICGKWRRAPLFEVQTDNWDCFRSILWDPNHADCSVPQDLETEEVLKQLKYIELLRPRLAAKRQKLEICGITEVNGSKTPTEDTSAETAV